MKAENWTETLFLSGLILIGIFLAFSFYNLTYDDVYLAFRYAKNILAGNGFVFNPGEKFLGTPAPFYVILLVIGKWLFPFLTIPQVGGWISGITLLLLSLFVYAIGCSFNQRLLGAFASIFIIFNPLIIMTLGSETPIFLMLVTAAFYFYYCKKQIYLASFLLALSILNRTEGVIPAAIFLGHFILTRKKFPIGASFLGLLTLSPWLIFAFLNFGSPLTNSMEAKIAQRQAGLGHFIPTALLWLRDIIISKDLFYLAFLPLLIFGLLYFLKKGKNWSILLYWIIAQTIVYLLLDLPFYHWYIAHMGLGLSIVAAMGAVELLGLSKKYGHIVNKAVPVFVIFIIIFALAAQVQSVERYHHPNPANQLYTDTGKWFYANTDPGTSIAYLEIGQIGYYSDRRIIDLLGLVTPGASERVKKGDFVWAYLNYEPDYIIYNPLFVSWTGVIHQESWFKESYTEVTRLKSPGYPESLIIYKKNPGVHLPAPLDVDISQLKRERPAGEIYGNKTVGQTIVSKQNNLSGIEIALTTFKRQNNNTAIFHLKDTPQSSTDIFTQEFSTSDIIDNAGYLFHFPAIEDSRNRSFYFYLESSNSSLDNSIGAWMALHDYYKDGNLWIGNVSLNNNDLTFKTFYITNKRDTKSLSKNPP